MPPHLGDFISEAVYDAQLASNPKHPKTKEGIYVRGEIYTGKWQMKLMDNSAP